MDQLLNQVVGFIDKFIGLQQLPAKLRRQRRKSVQRYGPLELRNTQPWETLMNVPSHHHPVIFEFSEERFEWPSLGGLPLASLNEDFRLRATEIQPTVFQRVEFSRGESPAPWSRALDLRVTVEAHGQCVLNLIVAGNNVMQLHAKAAAPPTNAAVS
jgi:hypothetical protein